MRLDVIKDPFCECIDMEFRFEQKEKSLHNCIYIVADCRMQGKCGSPVMGKSKQNAFEEQKAFKKAFEDM